MKRLNLKRKIAANNKGRVPKVSRQILRIKVVIIKEVKNIFDVPRTIEYKSL
jgi:hypothetical protein